MDQMFQEHSRLIDSCADKLCRRYKCTQLREDLVSVGNLTLLQMAGKYHPDSDAAMSTYLYPFLMGAMRREIEKSLYPVALTKDKFRKQGALWQTTFFPLEVYLETEKSYDLPVEQQVFNDIYLACVQDEFEKLTFRERQILGGFFGVYNYSKQTVIELAEEFQITENALLKAKDKALNRLRQACEEGEFGIWREVRKSLRKAQRKSK